MRRCGWGLCSPSLILLTLLAAATFAPEQAGARNRDREAVTGYFSRESYRPDSDAALVVSSSAPWLSLQILHIGAFSGQGSSLENLGGKAVGDPVRVAVHRWTDAQRVDVPIGDWPSGVYFAELRTPTGAVGFAPFVVLPRTLGEHRAAVVMPTNTWQAYNRRDSDGDGAGDTWYERWSTRTVDTTRPFLDRGVPPRFRQYDLPFLHWLAATGKDVDFLTDRELMRVGSGAKLASAYDLIVFPGHHEYVTPHEYDVVERYRDLGGNLMFLSANNFFWRVERRGDRMTRIRRWRDLGRPEAALIGVQYIASDRGKRRAPYVVRPSAPGPWIFADTGLGPGARFGSFGIEIDATAPSSPAGTHVVAEIPNLLGRGKTAQMTYYETPGGARVFAAGAFTLAGRSLPRRHR